jgi:DNA excision repair protein ERCC-6
VYHRQVYKQFLTDRVLRDPRQRRFFKARDLSDLFTLGEEHRGGNETAEIFASLGTEITAEDVAAAAAGGGGGGGAAAAPSDSDEFNSGDERAGAQPRRRRRQVESDGGGEGGLAGAVGAERDEEDAAAGAAPGAAGAGGGDGDARILRDLFDGSGVHAALDHDKIEGAHDPQHRAAEREAGKIAARAADALRQSRLQVQSAPVSQPTWTGRSGGAGAPRFGAALNPRLLHRAPSAASDADSAAGGAAPAAPRFGSGVLAGTAGGVAPRSSEVLARLRQSQQAAAAAGAAPEVAQARTLAERIAAFLRERGGAAPTADVVARFRREVGAADVAVFKGLLRQVAELQRRRGGKVWALRPEFVGAADAADGPS